VNSAKNVSQSKLRLDEAGTVVLAQSWIFLLSLMQYKKH
jgi:hypothetical protein